MSKFVKIKTELRDLVLIKKALEDVKISYQENSGYRHWFSGTTAQVPVLVKQSGIEFGLRLSDEGVYEIVGDDMHMRGIQQTMQKVQQRYAYHKVLTETEKAGFSLVEEKVGNDNVIRMTVRRWG